MGNMIKMFRAAVRRKNCARFAALLLLPLLILVGRAAFAAEYCVGTVTELNAALNEAVSPSQALFVTTIRLKQGTYHVGGGRLTQVHQAYFNALELLGGYNSDCSTRTVNPDNTIFDADAATYFKFEPLGALLIEGIRFQNIADYRYVSIWSAANDLTVSVRNNAFVGVGVLVNNGYTPESDLVSGLTMKFVNNRVHGYPGGPTSVAAVYMAGLSRIRFTGNTLADNLGKDAVEFCANSDVWLVDNIGWNNAGDDFHVRENCHDENPGAARSRSNLYQSVLLTPVGDSGGNLVGTNPVFLNAGTGNYRLQDSSPAVNSGVVSSSAAEIDLAGNPRVVGSTVDRGAYESSLDDTIPATLTVTTGSDSGPGSLRQAILDANVNADFSFINFNIPGACPRVIALTTTDLPPIVNGVRIDGYTQPGSASNTRSKGDNATRCIVLAGGSGRTIGLRFSGSSTAQFWLQGMAFSGFSPGGGGGQALRIQGGTGNIVRGNQFGARLSAAAGSLVLAPSDTNIVLTGRSSTTVGGESPAHRNVIADATTTGVLVTSDIIAPSMDNEIIDNLIGSYASEITAAGNGTGITIKTSGNTVRENTIINSGLDGILMDVATCHDNVLERNRIGIRDTICTGTFCFGGAAGNGRHGLFLNSGPHDNDIYNNTIRNNTGNGIFIFSDVGATSLRNWLTGNSLYNNDGAGTRFLAYNGADNDADPAQQNMANRGLNYPVITRAFGSAGQGTVQGMLSTTNGSYSIDIYSSALPDPGQPRGEAEVFHRSIFGVTVSNATAGQNGSASFSIPFPASPSASLTTRVITVTVTDAAGNTSELSAPAAYEFVPEAALFANGFEN